MIDLKEIISTIDLHMDAFAEEIKPDLLRAIAQSNEATDYAGLAHVIQSHILWLIRCNDFSELANWISLIDDLRFTMKLRILDPEKLEPIDVKLWTLKDFIEAGLQNEASNNR